MDTPLRDPYGAALTALRRFADAGRFGWGEALVVKDLAVELRLSPTPIREALACLSGEGLVERRRGRGYFYPSLSAADIIDLYDLEWAYVHSAVVLQGPGAPGLLRAAAVLPPDPDFEALFVSLVSQSGFDAIWSAYRGLSDRLAAVRRAESALAIALVPEAADVARAFQDPDSGRLVSLIGQHHRQRCGLASETARALRQTAPQETR